MAVNNYLVVSVVDFLGKSGKVQVRVAKNKATIKNAEDLSDFVKTHSDAKVVSYGARIGITGDAPDNGKYDRCQQRLKFLFKSSENASINFSYPAPRDEDVNERQEPESDVAEDVRDLLNGFGLNIPDSGGYNGGSLTGKPYSASERERELTGV
jgi:hypothetical protein